MCRYGVLQRYADFSKSAAVARTLKDQYLVYQALKPVLEDLSSVKITSVVSTQINGTTTTTQTTASLQRLAQVVTSDPAYDSGAVSDDSETSDSAVALIVIAALILVAMISVLAYLKYQDVAMSKVESVQLNDTMGPIGTGSSDRKFSIANLRGGTGSYLKQRNRNGLFRSERVPTASDFQAAHLAVNASKNLSTEHIPYDTNRVTLKAGLAAGSDYINASHIERKNKGGLSYIAAQGPLKDTVTDFWRMVVEKNANIVVMLTEVSSGVFQYWSETEGATYGDVTVLLEKTTKHTDYIVREFRITVDADPKELDAAFAGKETLLTHFQYLAFPDVSTPEDASTFLAFRRDVQVLQENLPSAASDAPLIVHCDKGCGRTGVFICLNSELQHYHKTGEVDLFDAVVAVRRNRAQCVETKAQYVFLHRAFLTELLTGPNRVTGTLDTSFKDFYEQFMIDPETTTFDIGRAGRQGQSFSTDFTLQEKNADPKAVSLAVMTDVIILSATNDDGKHLMLDYKSRDGASAKEHVKGGPNSIKLTLNSTFVLDAGDAGTKTEWLELLTSMDGFKSTASLTGERTVATRLYGRAQILNRIGCADPQTFDGSTSLKSEFGLIPRVFNVSGDSPGTNAQIETAAGVDRAVTNPLYRQAAPPIGQAYYGSPTHSPVARPMLGTNRFNFAPTGIQQSNANSSVMYGNNYPPSMGGPSLGYPTPMVLGGLPRDPLPSYNTHPPSFAESSFSMPQYNDGGAGYIEINGACPPGTMPQGPGAPVVQHSLSPGSAASTLSPYGESIAHPGAMHLAPTPAAALDDWVPETYDMEEESLPLGHATGSSANSAYDSGASSQMFDALSAAINSANDALSGVEPLSASPPQAVGVSAASDEQQQINDLQAQLDALRGSEADATTAAAATPDVAATTMAPAEPEAATKTVNKPRMKVWQPPKLEQSGVAGGFLVTSSSKKRMEPPEKKEDACTFLGNCTCKTCA